MSNNKYKVGKIIAGCVTGIEKYGIFVSLDEYYSGLIHISEISDSYVRNIGDYVTIGETIKVKVIEANDNDFHVKLSIKNIDYRLNKKKRAKIVETKQGFSTLEKMMKVWIEQKKEVISRNKAKKI
mgnify:FL=1